MDWETLSFILSSEKRGKVIKCLVHPTTPTMIAKETGISKAHVSRVLKKFMDMGLVECKTPKKRKGKIYVLTTKGKGVINHLSES
ncbi:MAG: winged helix-turn-helix transcriptional regulator [Candidatus Aenigmarchaeota archaeon]|nr:winged helix-turn-helix transcriptional regulator [Candidatus Aenigmarchaeota archaeon]